MTEVTDRPRGRQQYLGTPEQGTAGGRDPGATGAQEADGVHRGERHHHRHGDGLRRVDPASTALALPSRDISCLHNAVWWGMASSSAIVAASETSITQDVHASRASALRDKLREEL